jgi:hypothetical protein
MTAPERRPIADGSAPDLPEPEPNGAIHVATDKASHRAFQLERARKLTRRLRVRVVVDETGWLRGVELSYTRGPGDTIRPVTLRIGRDTPDDELLTGGGVLDRCARYNHALDRLRQLAAQLETIVRAQRVSLEPEVWQAHRELSRLNELVAHRQQTRMGHWTVRLATLTGEIEFFEGRVAHLAPLLAATEHAIPATEARATPPSPERWR